MTRLARQVFRKRVHALPESLFLHPLSYGYQERDDVPRATARMVRLGPVRHRRGVACRSDEEGGSLLCFATEAAGLIEGDRCLGLSSGEVRPPRPAIFRSVALGENPGRRSRQSARRCAGSVTLLSRALVAPRCDRGTSPRCAACRAAGDVPKSQTSRLAFPLARLLVSSVFSDSSNDRVEDGRRSRRRRRV